MNYKSKGYRVFQVFNVTILLLLMVVTLFPYLNVLAKSLNEGLDTMRGGIVLWPRKPTLENFQALLQSDDMLRAAVISVVRVILGTVLALGTQFLAAYAFCRRPFPGKKFMLVFLSVPMFLTGGLMPTYFLYSQIGLLNNFLVYILPTLFSFYQMVIIRTFISTTISVSLEEAATIDGANEFQVFWRIIIPLSKPILATIGLWIAVGHWNDWTTTLYYITRSSLFTLQYKLMEILKEAERIAKLMAEADANTVIPKSTPDALIAAQIIVTTLPVIVLYPFLQKYFIQGVMIGAVKE